MDKQTEGIIALVLNIFTIPGLGTVIFGDKKTGVIQLILSAGVAVVATVLSIITLGLGALVLVPLASLSWFVAWIWGIVSGVKLIQR